MSHINLIQFDGLSDLSCFFYRSKSNNEGGDESKPRKRKSLSMGSGSRHEYTDKHESRDQNDGDEPAAQRP